MFTLNIILLITSTALLVVGLALTWKPNPVYYFNEKTGKADKYRNNHLFILFCIPGIILYFLLLLEIGYSTGMIIYLSTLTLLIIAGVTIYYIQNKKSIKENKKVSPAKKNNSLASIKPYLSGFLAGAFIKNELVVLIFVALIVMDYCYGIIIRYKKEKFSNIYIYTIICIFYITTLFCLHIIFMKGLQVYIIYIILFLVFLMQVLTFINALGVKKHSPFYEKQYLEENSLQSNVSNNP